MFEDKLTRDERIRAKALKQAMVFYCSTPMWSESVLEVAKRYETYIREGSTK